VAARPPASRRRLAIVGRPSWPPPPPWLRLCRAASPWFNPLVAQASLPVIRLACAVSSPPPWLRLRRAASLWFNCRPSCPQPAPTLYPESDSGARSGCLRGAVFWFLERQMLQENPAPTRDAILRSGKRNSLVERIGGVYASDVHVVDLASRTLQNVRPVREPVPRRRPQVLVCHRAKILSFVPVRRPPPDSQGVRGPKNIRAGTATVHRRRATRRVALPRDHVVQANHHCRPATRGRQLVQPERRSAGVDIHSWWPPRDGSGLCGLAPIL